MDDIQLILYIIFVAIAILTRVFKSKKKDQPQPQQQSESEEYENNAPKPKSFEDLLKEFTGESTAVETEVSSYEEEYETDDEIETYESANYDKKELKTIDELVDLEDDRHTGNFKHFAGYEEQDEEVNSEYVEMLQNEEGARKAIILSEIINRKY
ncbi:MAG: hypothetical protein ABJH05_11185 [Fulvivirga sp.]